jgi:predicted XRE-type DNA-binding protein
MPLDYNEFAEKIKQQQPEYKNVDNYTLAVQMVEKYPQYKTKVDLKKKEVSQSTLVQDNTSSDRLSNTTTKPTVSSSLKGEGIYIIPGQAEGVFFKKQSDGWYKKQYGVFDYKKVTDPNRIKKIEANTVEYNPKPKTKNVNTYSFEKTPSVQEKPQEWVDNKGNKGPSERDSIEYWDNLLANKNIDQKTYDFHADRLASMGIYKSVSKALQPKVQPKPSEVEAQKVFKESFDALSDTDPEYLRRKAQQEKINASIKGIDSSLVGLDEGDVVPKINEAIKGYDYLEVEESGMGYDEVLIRNKVTGESRRVNLDNWTTDRNNEEAKILRGWLEAQMYSKEYTDAFKKVNYLRDQIQNATPTEKISLTEQLLNAQSALNKEKVKREAYVRGDKYLSSAIYDKNAQENVKVDLARTQLRTEDFIGKSKDYKDWSDKIQEAYNKGEISQEDYYQNYLPKLKAEKDALFIEQQNIKDDYLKIKSDQTSIDEIAADNFLVEENRGNVLTGAASSFLRGVESSTRFILEGMSEEAGGAKEGSLKGVFQQLAPGSVSELYTNSANRSTFEKIVFGLSESGGSAMAGLATGGPSATLMGLYAASYTNMKDQMNTPAFKDVPEWQKILMSSVYGGTVGMLEEIGIGKWFTKTPAGKGLTNWILKQVLTELPENATAEAIEMAIKQSTKAAIANGLIQVSSTGLVEGSTELAQEAADMVYKDIFNTLNDKKFFDNPNTWEGVFSRLGENFVLGFAGGAGMQSITQTTQTAKNAITMSQLNNIENLINNPNIKDIFKMNLKDQIMSGEITSKQAKEQLQKLDDLEATVNKIPKEVKAENKYQAFKLLNERDEIQKEIAGKDQALVAAQTERINAINDELKTISKNAVQERSTEEVLPREPETTGEAGGQREGMGQGVQGEIITEEGPITQEEKVAPKAEIGGIIRGYESISEQDNVGDVRSQLPNQNQGTAVVEGKDGNQYAVAFSRKGGDGKNIFEQGVTTPRPGYISASVKIEENATPEQVQAAQQEAQRNLDVILPTVVGGAINAQTINDVMAQQAPVVAPVVAPIVQEEVTTAPEMGTTVEVDQVAVYRAEEQAELLKAIPKIESYKVNGEIDKSLMPKTVLEKYNKIYEKYDKLISPLLETATQPKAAIASENEITEKNVRTMSVKYKRNPIVRTATNILKALPGVKIYLHENTDQYSDAIANKTGENKQSIESESSAGSYFDGEIHLDMSQANTVTLLHEAVHHALMVNGVKGNYIIDMANGLRGIIKDEARLAELDAFIEQYEGETDQETLETRSDEFVAQLGGILAANQEELTTTGLTKFKALINRLFKKLGLGNVFTKESTSQDAVNFINAVTRGLNVGENINNIGINGVFDTSNAKRKKSILATGLFERYPDNPNTKVEENVPLSRFNGKRSNVFESDRMTGAYIADDKGNKVFNFFGGIFFPRITGKWWASSSLSTATSIANNSKRDADGYIYGTPIIMSPGSQMSNNDMLLATLEFMKMDVMKKNSGVSKPELMTYIEKAFEKKKITGKKNILKNALKRTNNIEQIFDELEYVLFQEEPYIKDRSGEYILTDTRDRISKLTFEERKEIVSGILGDPKVMGSKFPSAGSISQMSDKFTEPETLKSKKLWDIVAVYRTKGNLVAKAASKTDEFYHKSYPYEILAVDENGNPAEIEVFMLDGAYNLTEAIPEMTKSSGDVFSWAEHEEAIKSGKYKSEAVALNQYGRTSKLSRGSGEISARKKQLVAPNGKPSNLNEKQWNQVRTPEFKKWFGDWENDPKNASKVVDENGEPKVVYHGSMNQFDEFKKEELGKATGSESSMLGFYFSDNKEVSETYIGPAMNQLDPNLDGLQSALDKMTKKQLGQFNVEVFNHYDDSDNYSDTEEDLEYFRDDLFTTVRIDSEGYLFDSQRYLEKAEKFIRSNNIDPDFRAYPEGYIYPTFINIRNPYIKDFKGDLWEYTPEFDNISKNNDGAILENTLDSVPTDERDGGIESNVFIVFEPNQIKSATENVGTFSAETPKIKFQKAPKILGQKPTKVIVNDEAKALIGQIKLEIRAQREQKKAQTEVRKSISDNVKAMVKKGSINLKQASTIISTLNRVNLDNQEMVKRFNDYIAKVFDKAEYIDKVDRATRMKKKIKQNLKGASNPFAIAAKGFSQLEPKWVENIDDYIAVAQAVYDSVRKSTVRKGVINWKQEADFQEIAQYVFDEEARQTEVLLGNLRNLYERITGKSSDGVGADVMQAELKDMSTPEDFSADVMDQIEERLAEFEQMVEDTDPDFVQKAVSIDPTIIPTKEAIRILDALDTYFTNGSTAGLNELMELYTGKENAIKFKYKAKPLRALGSKKLAQTKFQSITQFNMILERKFRTKEAALAYKKASGIQDIENGANKAEKQAMDKQREYVSKFGKVKGFNSAENIFQRGALANLLRTMVASEEMQQAEFDRNIEILRNSVDTLSKGNSNDQKKAKVYKKVLTQLGVFNPDVNLEMVLKNAKKENIDAVNFVIDMFGEIVDPLSDLAIGMYNQILTQDINYTPYVYKMTDLKGNYGSKDYGGTDKNGNPNLSFFGTSTYANQTFDKNKAGVLMPITRPKDLRAGMHVDLDFDNNMFRQYRNALVDIYTAGPIRRLDGFFNSEQNQKILNSNEDQEIIYSALVDYIRTKKGSSFVTDDGLKFLNKISDYMAQFGAARALVGVGQFINQFSSGMSNTIVNAGEYIRPSDFTKDTFEFIANSGRSIANVGGDEILVAMGEVDKSIERANLDSKYRVDQTLLKFIAKENMRLFNVLVAYPDAVARKLAWMAYYRKSMVEQGLLGFTESVDTTKPVNDKAADYAQMMVDRNMDSTDAALRGSLFRNRNSAVKILRSIFMPFSSFGLNQKNRMWNDLNSLFSGKDIITSSRSLASIAGELVVYNAIRYYIAKAILGAALSLLGYDDDDQEELYNKLLNNAKLSSFSKLFTDIVSPVPVLDNQTLKLANKTLKGSSLFQADPEAVDKYVEKLKAKGNLTDEEIEAKKKAFEEKNSRSFYVDTEANIGTLGIQYEKAIELLDLVNAWRTGEYTDDYNNERFLTKDSREKLTAPLMMKFFATVYGTRELDQVANKSFKLVKDAESMSKTQKETYSEVKKELGRDLTEFETSIINKKRTADTAIDEIKFIERNGGLNKEKGSEYLKLLEVNPSPTTDMLRDIQNGKTADQIIKKSKG